MKKIRKRRVFKSMIELEKTFFPEAFKKKAIKLKDAKTVGVRLAKESIDEVCKTSR